MAQTNGIIQSKIYLEMCIKILHEYSWLVDSYVLDFFVENHLSRLPESWQNHINSIPLEEFYYLLNPSEKTQTIWPLSLLCLRILIHFLQIPRKHCEIHDSLIVSNKTAATKFHKSDKVKSNSFEHSNLKNYFFKHVKPKKQYEIFKMAMITAKIAKHLNVTHVVDVGSGMGHLSRIMAYGFDLFVCSIETQSQLIQQAKVMDCEFEKISKRYLNESELMHSKCKRPVQMNQTIKFDLTANDFTKSIKEAFSFSEDNFKFGIIGLHPCGDLAAVLLKLYTDSPEAKFINLVGCCYHKLSTSSDSSGDIGFPLTDFCVEKRLNISYEARALACHAIESYRERLLTNDYDHLKVHCYRAALEYLINKNWPEYRKCSLGNVKSIPGLKFNEYCQLALKKVNLTLSEEDLRSEETLKNLSKWEDVVKFYSLRLMLAPLIESSILLDRKIFLLEKGFQCRINAAFNPEISPRNQVLFSRKIS